MGTVPQVRRIIFNDEEIGMGFSSESGIAVGTALEGFTIQQNPAASGQQVTASITIVNTHEELMDTLGMSFAAQGRYGFFSASAKADFAESSNYNSTSTFVVARCLVQNPLTRGENFHVTAAAQALLSSGQTDQFKSAFGDSFVRGLQTGGEFYSVIRITSISVTNQTSLAASLQAEANGLVASGSFRADFTKANTSASTQSEFTATMYQRAGSGSQISPTVEIDEVIARFKQFPQIAASSAVAFETEVATYDTIPLPLPTPEEQEDFLLALSDARDKKLQYIQSRNDLDFALRNPAFFQDLPSSDVLSTASGVYTKLINAVIQHAIALSSGQITPPRLFDPSALTPPLTEPGPITLQRVPPPPDATIQVPNLIGLTAGVLTNVFADLERPSFFATTDAILQDVAAGGRQVSAQVVEFMGMSLPFNGSKIQLQYIGVDRSVIEDAASVEGQHDYVINAQSPAAGVLVAPGVTVSMVFTQLPDT